MYLLVYNASHLSLSANLILVQTSFKVATFTLAAPQSQQLGRLTWGRCFPRVLFLLHLPQQLCCSPVQSLQCFSPRVMRTHHPNSSARDRESSWSPRAFEKNVILVSFGCVYSWLDFWLWARCVAKNSLERLWIRSTWYVLVGKIVKKNGYLHFVYRHFWAYCAKYRCRIILTNVKLRLVHKICKKLITHFYQTFHFFENFFFFLLVYKEKERNTNLITVVEY